MKLLLALILAFVLNACSHAYFYRPEVEGAGATYAKRGVIYTIPAGQPEVKMKLTSLGLTTPPSTVKTSSNSPMLEVRALIVRMPNLSDQVSPYLDPAEQKLILPGGYTAAPAAVHASVPKNSKLVLNSKKMRHGADLYFPLPGGLKSENEMQSFSMQWVVHYGHNQVETQTVRFDRMDKAEQTNGGGGLDEFGGYGETAGFAPGADGGLDGWSWWGI